MPVPLNSMTFAVAAELPPTVLFEGPAVDDDPLAVAQGDAREVGADEITGHHVARGR